MNLKGALPDAEPPLEPHHNPAPAETVWGTGVWYCSARGTPKHIQSSTALVAYFIKPQYPGADSIPQQLFLFSPTTWHAEGNKKTKPQINPGLGTMIKGEAERKTSLGIVINPPNLPRGKHHSDPTCPPCAAGGMLRTAGDLPLPVLTCLPLLGKGRGRRHVQHLTGDPGY